jgi:ribosomal protein L11 methyltransferase
VNGVVLRAALPETLPPAHYDLVLANILAQPLIVLAPLLIERVAPGGRLALAGLLLSQVEEVAQPYREALDLELTAASEGWALLEGARR